MPNTSITPYHAKYYANELILQKASNDDSRLSSLLFNSSLAINPHQIDAALFAFKSPLSKGVLLADEVGLGKTIEAGLVLCQLWSERKRHLLVICPAALRKQWSLERVNQKNLEYVRAEEEQLDKWTEDMIIAIEKELDLVKKQIREAERSLRLATSTQEHLEIQEELQKLNKKKRVMRVTLEENEEEIQEKRDKLIDEIKQRAKTNTKLEKLFTIEWEVR